MIQILAALATHTFALVIYPGLLTVLLFGGAVEGVWSAVTGAGRSLTDVVRRRPTPVVATIALCAILTAVQLAAPFNLVPSEERNVVVAAAALGFTLWAALALTVELVPEPRLLLVIQFCWLLAVMGPAVQPESLRPQVLGNVLVPGLLPVKVACAFLYLLCLPALLGLWPIRPEGDRRAQARLNVARGLCWFPYCGLFATLFFPPSGDDVLGVARFFGISFLVAATALVAGTLLNRRGAAIARGLYARAVPPYAALVLALVVVTAALFR